jgi:hypothetical protein
LLRLWLALVVVVPSKLFAQEPPPVEPAPIPAPAPTVSPAPAEPLPTEAHDHEHAGHACDHGKGGEHTCPRHHEVAEHGQRHGKRFALAFDGYVRLEYQSLFPDRFVFFNVASSDATTRNPYVGRNDGFMLGGARMNLRGTYDKLYIRLGFDGAVTSFDESDPVVGTLSTGLKDAYFRYDFHPLLEVYGGRFKPPFDIEELTPEEDQLFVHRALESRGVLAHEGYAGDMPGMRPGRQLGVMIAGPRAADLGPVALGYMVAVTNGNGGDANLNDDDLPAGWLRLTGAFGGAAKPDTDEEGPATLDLEGGGLVGLSAFVNRRSFGTVPNRRRDLDVGVGVDVATELAIVDLRAQLLWIRTTHLVEGGGDCFFEGPDGCIDNPHQTALGGHAQVGVHVPGTGLTPGYRFAIYDPRWQVRPEAIGTTPDVTRVVHHTVGVRYAARELPVVSWLEYTRSLEEENRAIPNDRIQAAVQVSFE